MATQSEKSKQFAAAVTGESDIGDDATKSVREAARARLDGLDLPEARDEEWRFLRLSPLTGLRFEAPEQDASNVTREMVEDYVLPEAETTHLVFVNGQYEDTLSKTAGIPDGVVLGHLSDHAGSDLVSPHLGNIAEYYDEDYFAALNTAGFDDGVFLHVPDDTEVEPVIQLLFIATEGTQPFAVQPRNLMVLGDRSHATVVEDYVGPHGGVYFNNVLDEVSLGEASELAHVRVQRDGEAAFHINRIAVDQSEGSHYNSTTITLGARFSRYDVYANGDAEHIDSTLDGLAVLDRKQVSDTHTVMDHRQPNGGSHQLHKMILDGSSHAVFNGKIFVQQDAQKIDAYQLNRTLLLSDHARVNTKPQLEIFADDVKCTHGATVGQLEEDQLFYMRSRGLDEKKARNLLVYAFAAEVIETIPVPSLVENLEVAVTSRTAKA
ncbi:MAG: Fe-S cluster assembly protein SufD [Myxococcota bacterium]